MSRLRKMISHLIGFTRGEKRATLVVALLLVAVIILRYSAEPGTYDTVIVTPVSVIEESEVISSGNEVIHELFYFDPNTVTMKELAALGMSEKQATVLKNYRDAGAKFNKAADLLKVYGIDSSLVYKLAPYVVIGHNKEKVVKEIASGYSAEESIKNNDSQSAILHIELNSCSPVDLQALPGIGTVLSERIVKYRNLLGGFVTPRQISEVYGIDTVYLGQIYSMVYVNTDSVRRIRLDSCSYKELARHPYIKSEKARAIIKYRSLAGPPRSIEQLVEQRVIDSVTARKIGPYCLFKEL